MPLLTDDACLDPEINVDEDGSVSNKMLVVLLGRGYCAGKISKADVSFARGSTGAVSQAGVTFVRERCRICLFHKQVLVLLGEVQEWIVSQAGVTFAGKMVVLEQLFHKHILVLLVRDIGVDFFRCYFCWREIKVQDMFFRIRCYVCLGEAKVPGFFHKQVLVLPERDELRKMFKPFLFEGMLRKRQRQQPRRCVHELSSPSQTTTSSMTSSLRSDAKPHSDPFALSHDCQQSTSTPSRRPPTPHFRRSA